MTSVVSCGVNSLDGAAQFDGELCSAPPRTSQRNADSDPQGAEDLRTVCHWPSRLQHQSDGSHLHPKSPKLTYFKSMLYAGL